MIRDTSQITYRVLIDCAFCGGEDYENLILNDEYMRRIILNNEADLQTPNPDKPKKKRQIHKNLLKQKQVKKC